MLPDDQYISRSNFAVLIGALYADNLVVKLDEQTYTVLSILANHVAKLPQNEQRVFLERTLAVVRGSEKQTLVHKETASVLETVLGE